MSQASAPNADGDTSGSEEDDDSEGWETASEAEVAAAEGSDADMGDGDVQDWEEWDEKRCLFCSRWG